MNGSSYRPTIRSLEINIQWRKVIVHQTWNYRQKHIQVNSSHFCTAHKIKPTIHMQNTNTGEAFFFFFKKKEVKKYAHYCKNRTPTRNEQSTSCLSDHATNKQHRGKNSMETTLLNSALQPQIQKEVSK